MFSSPTFSLSAHTVWSDGGLALLITKALCPPCYTVVALAKCHPSFTDSHGLGTKLGDNKLLLWFQSGFRKLTRDSVENSGRSGEIIDFITDSQTETDKVLIGDFLGIVGGCWSRVQRHRNNLWSCVVEPCATTSAPRPNIKYSTSRPVQTPR